MAVQELLELADDARTSLVRNALELLNQDHPEDLSIREVARRAGLSSGAPYHHFKTKSDLLAACAVVAWTHLCEQLEADETSDPHQALLRRANIYMDYARSNPGPYRLMTSRLLDDDRRFEEIVALRARAMGGVIDLIVAAPGPSLSQAQAKLRGVALWSMLHGQASLEINQSLIDASELDLAMEIPRLAVRMALLPTS
ncbi:MAG: TetR/AcrR family transcriptional regulator [Acidimicrobiales bacterium]